MQELFTKRLHTHDAAAHVLSTAPATGVGTAAADEAVQHGRMAAYGEGVPVSAILRHEDGIAPPLIGFVVASIVGLHLQRVGQHIAYTLVAVIQDNHTLSKCDKTILPQAEKDSEE